MRTILRVVTLIAAVGSMGSGSCFGSTSPNPAQTTYSGPVSGPLSAATTATGGNSTVICTTNAGVAGSMTITLTQGSGGQYTGTSELQATETQIGATVLSGTNLGPNVSCPAAVGIGPIDFKPSISGTAGNLQGSQSTVSGGITNVATFAGSLSGGLITGVITLTMSGAPSGGVTPTTIASNATFNVTLR